MDMPAARKLAVLVGLIVPHAANAYRGHSFSLADFLFLLAFSPFYWGSVLLLTARYRYPIALLPPTVLGYGFVFYCFGILDWGTDAQAALGYIWFPIYAVVPTAIGAVIGYVMDRWIGLGPPSADS